MNRIPFCLLTLFLLPTVASATGYKGFHLFSTGGLRQESEFTDMGNGQREVVCEQFDPFESSDPSKENALYINWKLRTFGSGKDRWTILEEIVKDIRRVPEFKSIVGPLEKALKEFIESTIDSLIIKTGAIDHQHNYMQCNRSLLHEDFRFQLGEEDDKRTLETYVASSILYRTLFRSLVESSVQPGDREKLLRWQREKKAIAKDLTIYFLSESFMREAQGIALTPSMLMYRKMVLHNYYFYLGQTKKK